MEFPKIGDKYYNNLSGVHGEIINVEHSTKSVKYKSSNDVMSYFSWRILTSYYTKIKSEIELGSRWLLPDGRLITVSSKDRGMIKYYFGEAYCFTKVRFSKYESTFLSDCSPFTGNLDDYDTSGNKVIPPESDFLYYSSDDSVTVKTSGSNVYVSPNTENVSVSVDSSYVVPSASQIQNIAVDMINEVDAYCLPLVKEVEVTKPLWKRILRKLV